MFSIRDPPSASGSVVGIDSSTVVGTSLVLGGGGDVSDSSVGSIEVGSIGPSVEDCVVSGII